MREPTTYIKLDRNLLKWRWIGDPNTLAVWIWLLLSANIEPHDFKDQTIGRGEICCSCARIATELHLSEKNVRTAIAHLLKTGEISKNRQIGKTPIYYIEGFSRYQGKLADSWQIAGTCPADSRQIGGRYPAEIKEYKNNKKDKNDKKGKNARAREAPEPEEKFDFLEELDRLIAEEEAKNEQARNGADD